MSYKADSILKNQIFNLLIQILNIVFTVVSIPYITRVLGPSILGEINFANSIVQYFMIIAMAGIPVYATREIARNRENYTYLRKTFKEIAILQCICTCISILAYLVLIFSSSSLKNNLYIYLLLGIQIFSNSFNYVWFIQGLEKYKYSVIATTISKLINIIMIFMLLKSRDDYYIYAFIIGITVFINVFINMIISLRLLGNFNTDDKLEIKSNNLKIHVQSMLIFLLSDVAIKIYTIMDQTMLGLLDSKESVGYYSMSIKIVKVLLGLVTSLVVVMIPRISSSIKNNNTSEVKRYINGSIKLVYILAIPTIFGILAIGEEVVSIYLGQEFLQSVTIFKIVSLNLVIIGLNNVFGMQIMIPYGKEKEFTRILLSAAVLNFTINLILIPRYSYMGATYATLFVELWVTVLMYFEVRKLVGDIPAIFKPWKMLIPSIIFYSVITLIIKSSVTSDIGIIFISIPVAGIIYLLGLIILKEDTTISILKRIFISLKKYANKGE